MVEGAVFTSRIASYPTRARDQLTPQCPRWLTEAAVWVLAAAFLYGAPRTAVAAEIKVFSAGAVRAAVQELAPAFEHSTHHSLAITYGTAGALRATLDKGAPADIVILPREAVAEAEANGSIQPATRRDLAHVAIGLAVRTGTRLPDISTPEALKRALQDAHAVAYVDPTRGTSGRYFDQVVLPALGIASEVRAKAKLQSEGSAAEFLRRGEADIAVQQISELLSVEGVTVVGPLPAPLQKVSTYSAAVTVNARAPELAQELIDFLSTPASQAVFKARGMDAVPVP